MSSIKKNSECVCGLLGLFNVLEGVLKSMLSQYHLGNCAIQFKKKSLLLLTHVSQRDSTQKGIYYYHYKK